MVDFWKMKADIISIGDELLIGQTVNTNASWIAKALDDAGVEVGKIITIGDDVKEIRKSVKKSFKKNDLVLVTGGLGPTHDDITKDVLCKLFDDHLVFDQQVYEDVCELLKKFGRTVSDLNKTQAMVPSKCRVIRNDRGTAPGMIFTAGGKILVSMPGVPFEMKNMVTSAVIPKVLEQNLTIKKMHRHIKTFGIAEADLSEKLKPVIEKLPSSVNMAFLPSPGHVKIRLSVRNRDLDLAVKLLSTEEKKVVDIIGSGVYGFDDDSLEVIAGKLLTENNLTVSTAESCTGGFLASRISSVPGASNYFKGSVIAYSNEVKQDLLKVSQDDLEQYGAVSDEVVCQMARGVRELLHTDYGLATSGIAGPEGGTEDKPVGTIWIALANASGVKSLKLRLGFNRALNISLTTDHVLNFLRKELTISLD